MMSETPSIHPHALALLQPPQCIHSLPPLSLLRCLLAPHISPHTSPHTHPTPAPHSETAVLLEGSRVCRRRLLKDILLCVGGVQQLLPLFSMLDTPTDGPNDAPHPTAADALDLVAAVLAGRLNNWRDFRHVHGTQGLLKPHALLTCVI